MSDSGLHGGAKSWTIASVLRWATEDFRGKGIESPRLDAEVLLAHALHSTRMQLVIESDKPLGGAELARFRELVKRRRTREPVAYLLGVREFYGRTFRVDGRVLVPRPDTETLVEVALARTRHVSLSARTLDLCTGSGCVAVTLARERPTGFVWGTDVSEGALAVARWNAERLGAYNVAFALGDLFAAIEAVLGRGVQFDMVTANPPYIPSAEIDTLMTDVRSFEPRLALDGGEDGLSFVRRIALGAKRALVPGGALAVEIAMGQAPSVRAIFESSGFEDVRTSRDYGGIERVVHGVCGAFRSP